MSLAFPTIAVDGPAASGKGTLARRLAEAYQFAYLDTGLLYRAMGVLTAELNLKNEAEISFAINEGHLLPRIEAKLKDPGLRLDSVAQLASQVASMASVRASLLKFQHDFCEQPPFGKKGAVLDGRDIGTVIAPLAEVKLFITASVEARASRRWQEVRKLALQGPGEAATEATVLTEMKERDARDASRAIAPAKAASDAVILDTTNMTADEAFRAALEIAEGKLPRS